VLIVRTPEGRDAMRRYVCSVVLGEWLGLPWRHEPQARADVAISIVGDDRELRLPDELFSVQICDWLGPGSLPRLPLTQWNAYGIGLSCSLINAELPVLYGTAVPTIEREGGALRLPIDLLGSIFFMLTAYDELVSNERDEHGRYPGLASVAYRSGIIERPLADEYCEVLWHALHTLWPGLKRKKLNPKVLISCDVDQPFDCTVSNFRSFVRATAGDLIKRRAPRAGWRRLIRFINNRRADYSHDPCYTFDNYIALCDEYNMRASFYFIPSSSEPNNGCYNLREAKIQRLMRKLSDAGHEIGMHGCYEAYRDATRTCAHRDLLRDALSQAGVSQPLIGNRQHYLRWDSARTPAVLQAADFVYDTSGGYADHAGFRYGTAREFPMWDWGAKAQLTLRQRPLIVMDCTITDDVYMGLGRENEASAYIEMLRKRALKFGGQFTALWHNTGLACPEDYQLLRTAIGRR
jgi:peptidoglycan/xylan/chitin deacetylase (PgdA/CDA1 family)